MKIDYTIYARQGEHGYHDGNVGISIPPLPSVTKTELHDLIDQLIKIVNQMKPLSPYQKYVDDKKKRKANEGR